MRYLCLLFTFLSINGSVLAQTCCSAGAPLTSTFQIAQEDKNVLGTQLKYTYRSINRLVDNQEILENDPRTRLGSNLLLKADYTLSEKIAVGLVMPYVFQSRTTFSEEQASSGIGDVLLVSQYQHAIKKETTLNFSLGIKLPTGQVSHRGVRGVILSPDMQSGTGTFDFLIGSNLTKLHFLKKNVTASVGLLYRKNTTNNNFGNLENAGGRMFKFGDEFLANFTLSHQQIWGTWFAVPYLNINYRTSQANREEGQVSPNSGGHWLGSQLGLQLAPVDKFNFKIFGQTPFFQALTGLQITTDYELGIEFNYKFNVKRQSSLIE